MTENSITNPVRVRVAPSPTGLLHVGNVRAGLYNWLYARRHNGNFMLRIDDTDQSRSKPEYEEAIKQDLHWLGLDWDRTAKESDRMQVYADLAEQLKQSGRVYACYETQDELDLKRKAQVAQKRPPVYDRAALSLSAEEKAKYEAQGRAPHWRFKLDHATPIVWDDGIQGRKEFNAATMSDPVIYRADGLPLFTFCGMVDDLIDETTLVIRGEDHVANTALQIQIGQALAPLMGKQMATEFAHFPLFTTITGEEMSKRLGTMSIRQMRDEFGLEPLAIVTYVARLGTSLPMEPVESIEALAASFDLGTISRNPPKIDMEELRRLNAKLLHAMPFEAVEFRLHQLGLPEANEAFWLAVRGELQVLTDVKLWWDVIHSGCQPVIEDAAFAKEAADLLPPEPWDQATFGIWAKQVSAKTGAKGKALFMPLRKAITGQEHGPDMGALLPLIGRMRVLTRLNGGHQ